MFCLVQYYIQLKEDLARHQPFLKILSVKLVIFLCFWQSLLIAILTAEKGPLKPNRFVAGPDLQIGIPCILTCIEMAIFALLHQWAFPWNMYDVDDNVYSREKYVCGPVRALAEAIYPWDYFKAAGRGLRWLFYGVRFRKESLYNSEWSGRRKQSKPTKARSEGHAELNWTGSHHRKKDSRKTV